MSSDAATNGGGSNGRRSGFEDCLMVTSISVPVAVVFGRHLESLAVSTQTVADCLQKLQPGVRAVVVSLNARPDPHLVANVAFFSDLRISIPRRVLRVTPHPALRSRQLISLNIGSVLDSRHTSCSRSVIFWSRWASGCVVECRIYLQSEGCVFESQPGLLRTKVHSAFYHSWVGK